MQCPSCRAVYSNGLDLCPRCKTPAEKSPDKTITEPLTTTEESVELSPTAQALASEEIEDSPAPATAQASSTLIEFPGVSRSSRPQWRKELSERVREIQERRARDAEVEVEEVAPGRVAQPAAELAASPQLGLVPQAEAPAMNPIVVAALKRLERARQPNAPMPRTRSSMGGAAAAAIARVDEEQYQSDPKPGLAQVTAATTVPAIETAQSQITENTIETKTVEPTREHSLIVVPAQPVTKVAAPARKPEPKPAVTETVEKTIATSTLEESSAVEFDEEIYDDRAPALSRVAGSLIDLLVVAFASSPFAAIIELTNGNWADWRVLASMGGIMLVVMFLYLTAATALAGRTWGMSLMSLRAVDADTGLPPTTKQSVGRALLYILSLITLGFGILYALFDAEGRTAHDFLSGTAVVRE